MSRKDNTAFNLEMIDQNTKRCEILRYMAEKVTVSTVEIADLLCTNTKAAYAHLISLESYTDLCTITKKKANRANLPFEFTLESINMHYSEFRSLKIQQSHESRVKKEAKRKREKKKKELIAKPIQLSGIPLGDISYSSRANGYRDGGIYVG